MSSQSNVTQLSQADFFSRGVKWSRFFYLLAPLSGFLLALCFPAFHISGLVWVWMLPLLPLIWRGERKRYGFGVAFLAGFTFWLVNLKWLWEVSGVGAIGLALFLSLYFGIWGMFAVSLGNPWRRRSEKRKTADKKLKASNSSLQKAIEKKQKARKKESAIEGAVKDSIVSVKFAFINAAVWVGMEWLRGWVFTGFGWNGLGVTFHDTPVLAQAADLVGVTGLAFTPVFVSAIVVQTARRLISEAQSGKFRPRLDFGVAALLLVCQFAYGVWRLRDVQTWDMKKVRVLLVQENIPQTIKWDPSVSAEIIQGYSDSTTQAVEALEKETEKQLSEHPDKALEIQTPDLLIWPESSMQEPLLFAKNFDGHLLYDEVRSMIENDIRPLGHFTLISGMNEMEADFDPELQRAIPLMHGEAYNSIVFIPPQGEIEQSIKTYHKIHLVLFGEYIPLVNQFPILKKIFKFSSGTDYYGNFNVGTSTDPVEVPVCGAKVDIIPSICFEDTVGRLTRQFVRTGKPQMIVNLTNDGWFKESEAAEQHWTNAKFRAIELRRPLVRCANTGVSGIISVTGSSDDAITKKRQVIEDKKGNHFTRGTLYGKVYLPKKGPITLYAMLGDWFAWLMMASVVFSMVRRKLKT